MKKEQDRQIKLLDPQIPKLRAMSEMMGITLIHTVKDSNEFYNDFGQPIENPIESPGCGIQTFEVEHASIDRLILNTKSNG